MKTILNETWLTRGEKDRLTIKELTPDGFIFLQKPRKYGKGGGLAEIHKSTCPLQINTGYSAESFERMEVNLHAADDLDCIKVIVLYHPPRSKCNQSTRFKFIEEFGSYLESLVTVKARLIIL